MIGKNTLALVVVILALASSVNDASACIYSSNCSQPPDGTVTCQASCRYPATCEVNTDVRCDQACYRDNVVGACFDTEEACCVVRGGGF